MKTQEHPIRQVTRAKALETYLRSNSNRVVTRAEVAANVWGCIEMRESRTFDQYVKLVRRSLVEQKTGEVLETIYGAGWRFVPAVKEEVANV